MPRPIEWTTFQSPQPYPEALLAMEARAAAIQADEAPETIWLMEHPPLLTAGHGIAPDATPPGLDLPVLRQRRAGGYQYYGPGLRMVYPMLRVTDHAPDVACFVRGLEKWAIATCQEFNLPAELRQGQLGAWVTPPARMAGPAASGLCRIASFAVRVRRGISLQGFALHVEPDLPLLDAFGPPTDPPLPNTSLVDQGYPVTFADVDLALMRSFDGSMPGATASCTRF